MQIFLFSYNIPMLTIIDNPQIYKIPSILVANNFEMDNSSILSNYNQNLHCILASQCGISIHLLGSIHKPENLTIC